MNVTNIASVSKGRNAPSYDDLLQICDDLGQAAGKGKDTQVRFLLAVMEAGYNNVIDLTPDKHGPEKDDATVLSERYVKAQTSNTMFDAKAPNQRKTISCTRVMIKLGSWPKGGVGEPIGTANKLMTIRQKLRANPQTAGNLDDAANTLLKYARRQIAKDRDHLLDDDELKELCFKKSHDLPDALAIIEGHRKALRKLFDGKAAGGTARDNSVFVKTAIDALSSRVVELQGIKRREASGGQNEEGE